MSQRQRLIRLPLVGAAILCLLIGGYMFASKRFSKPGPSARISKHSVETPSDDVLKYWTANKKRNAKPADLPNTNALKQGKQHPRRSPHASNPPDA